MQRTFTLLLAFAGVLIGLLLFTKLSGVKNPVPGRIMAPQDFGVGQIRTRKQALSDGLVIANRVKTPYAEYYANTGKAPENNQDLQLPPPDTFRGVSLQRIDTSPRGITLTYDEKSGVPDGRIVLTAQFIDGNIKWTCTSPSYADITNLIPACTYVAQ
jgi:hypothetical protein